MTTSVQTFCYLIVFTLTWVLSGCTSTPEGVTPISDFQEQRYLGKWYEIARLDHSFERGLSNVTAEYSLREDGGIDVINRGYNEKDGEWEQADGKAYFVSGRDIGHLKVSFFGPFYASYVIAELDKNDYRYALVTGPDFEYLWILSRTPTLAADIQQQLVEKARALGFQTDDLIFIEHNRSS